ncbi:MAG: [FeFe] hydrogenase H-cluster radical SAM maturase HydE [Stygiobacter sp.]|jgi:biotin synthase
MISTENIIAKLKSINGERSSLTKDECALILSDNSKELRELLFKKAYEVKLNYVGNKVYFRGLIEYSNICIKDCYYCGVRKSNKSSKRYQLSDEEVLKAAEWALENRFGSIIIQAGERTDRQFVFKIEKLVKEIKRKSDGKLSITLSLGEQTEEVYKRWFEAGAHRYLLRIETSNPKLYKKLHPQNHSFDNRLRSLYSLKQLGYQMGTGVMIGLPFQTTYDLVNDLYFFKEFDVDMIGMGPYLLHHDTPLAFEANEFKLDKDKQYFLSLKMIALSRIILGDVNIASTTALQAIKPMGREYGLLAGANVIMPNITEQKYRSYYKLYEDKPCLNENYDDCRDCLEKRITMIGEKIGYDEWGDSIHFRKRIIVK